MAKSLAIAYSMKKKKNKGGVACASGGTVESGDAEMNLAKGGKVSKGKSGGHEKGVHSSYSRDTESEAKQPKGQSNVGDMLRRKTPWGPGTESEYKEKVTKWAKKEHGKVLAELREDKTDRKNLAEGGEVRACVNCGYSEGGQVSNDTDFLADTLPNEFDDLVLRDDEEIGNDTVSRALAKRKKK